MWLQNCLLWIMFCCCFSHVMAKQSDHISAAWLWKEWKRNLDEIVDMDVSFPTLLKSFHLLWTPIKWNLQFQVLLILLAKKKKKMQEEKMKTITNLSDNVVTTLFYHMRGVFKWFTYLVCAYKQKTEEVDIPCKKMN